MSLSHHPEEYQLLNRLSSESADEFIDDFYTPDSLKQNRKSAFSRWLRFYSNYVAFEIIHPLRSRSCSRRHYYRLLLHIAIRLWTAFFFLSGLLFILAALFWPSFRR